MCSSRLVFAAACVFGLVACARPSPGGRPSPPAFTEAPPPATLAPGSDSSTPPLAASAPIARVPSKHRASSPPRCSTAKVRGDPQRMARGGCTRDANCTKGKNGRCAPESYEAPTRDRCYYDACWADADCAPNTACECGSGSAIDPHVCVEAACRIDTDCGAGGYCSPSPDGCGQVASWRCHTPDDACVDDRDCGNELCAFDEGRAHWACRPRDCM